MGIDFVYRLDEAQRNEKKKEKTRSYIGASGIGNECEAAVHFALRGYTDTAPDPRLKRIFRDGHRIENDVVRDLKLAGINVMEKDPMTKRQWEYTGFGGHAIGHADGLYEAPDGEIWLVEIKSMNDNKFKSFAKDGVKVSHRNYYAQVQFMMGLSKIQRCFFVSYNKNTSEYAEEEIHFDDIYYAFLSQRVENILSGNCKRISKDETEWSCRGCFKRESCWEDKPVPKTKRTCANAMPNKEGDFVCEKGCQEECLSWKRWKPLPKT